MTNQKRVEGYSFENEEPIQSQEFLAPIRALVVEGGKLYALTDDSVGEVVMSPLGPVGAPGDGPRIGAAGEEEGT